MAFTQGVAQTVHITTMDGADPVAPTNPAVTVSLDGGATFEAPDNAAVTTAYGISLALSAAETARAAVLVRVTADNADSQVVTYYFEGDYTATRAGYLDAAISSRLAATWASGVTTLKNWLGLLAGKAADATTLAEVNATTAGATYANTTDSLQAVRDALATVGSTTTTIGGTTVVDGELRLEVPRGDSYTLVVTATDSAGDAIDLSGYDAYTLTVKPMAKRSDAYDTNAVFQATGVLSGAGNNVLTFALTPANTEACDLDVWYDIDVEASDTARASVRTVIKGKYRSTLDVTRGDAPTP